MTLCDFEFANGTARCTRCGRILKGVKELSRVRARCRLGRNAERKRTQPWLAQTATQVMGYQIPTWERQRREDQCRECDKFNASSQRCSLIDLGCHKTWAKHVVRPSGRCPLNKWQPTHVSWISTADLAQRAVELVPRIPPGITRVIGIPRSGMIPASIIATMLHVPLYTLRKNTIQPVGAGVRMRDHRERKGETVLVDDTVHNGKTLKQLRLECDEIQGMLTAVCYARQEAAHVADLVGQFLPTPHFLEWNFPNCFYAKHLSWDMDGIICHNPPRDNEPYLLPRITEVGSIVTARPESERERTLSWLDTWGASTRSLVMWQGSERDRWNAKAIGSWKADETAKAGSEFYVESEPEVADQIRKHGVRTLCPKQGYLQ